MALGENAGIRSLWASLQSISSLSVVNRPCPPNALISRRPPLIFFVKYSLSLTKSSATAGSFVPMISFPIKLIFTTGPSSSKSRLQLACLIINYKLLGKRKKKKDIIKSPPMAHYNITYKSGSISYKFPK